MIELAPGKFLIQTIEDLPRIPDQIEFLFADVETTSGDPKLSSVNPWFDCEILGYAFTWDNEPVTWYLPVRHKWGQPSELTPEAGAAYFAELLRRARHWTNHNVKYDAHAVHNSGGCDVLNSGELHLEDTVTLAKLVDSDRWDYSLDALTRDWLPEEYHKAGSLLEPYLKDTKDYGDTPADIMGLYACQDVNGNRALKHLLLEKRPETCHDVWQTEIDLTTMLVNAERCGVRVDKTELQVAHMQALTRVVEIEESLHHELGTYVRPHVTADCFDLLCNRFGLPVMLWTNPNDKSKPSNPSFSKEALNLYLAHPAAPKLIVQKLLEARQLNTFISLFAEPYQNLNINGIMHAWFNQSVRTGRMSASKPNLQQLSKLAKRLIHPRSGHYFQSHDYSQVEFRVIVHYIGDYHAIKAYNDDPYTDFHQWVASMCNIGRKPAKTVNFMMGYGAGRKKTLSVIATNPDVAQQIEEAMDRDKVPSNRRVATFNVLSQRQATNIFDTYHATLPTLKSTSKKAETVCKQRGWVKDWYGRVRHLPYNAAHRAFNSVCQATAADLMKERAVALYKATRGTGIEPVGLVHDEFLLSVPDGYEGDNKMVSDIVGLLESPERPLSVPIKTSTGWASESWAAASNDSDRRDKAGERVAGTFDGLAHLKS